MKLLMDVITRTAAYNLFKKMKKIITLTVMWLMTIASVGQNVQHAQIKALYQYTELRRHIQGHDFEDSDDMMLLASPVGSRFFSVKTEEYDSLMSSPGGKEKYSELLKIAATTALVIENGSLTVDRNKVNLPSHGKNFQVTRSDNSDTLTVIDYAAQEDFTYTVPITDLVWELNDSAKVILGYDCLMATSNYHGRKWVAWYAPDIPIQSGPWQLMGLPGLIMEAESAGGEYKFTIKGLEVSNIPINPRPGNKVYSKISRKDFRKLQRELQHNPGKQWPDGSVKIENLEESVKARTAHDLIETDYK